MSTVKLRPLQVSRVKFTASRCCLRCKGFGIKSGPFKSDPLVACDDCYGIGIPMFPYFELY